MKNVIVIGGGPAGIFCALAIKEKARQNINVIIVERLEKIGKKLLATGNGKCNFSNRLVDKEKYNNPEFVSSVLNQFGHNELIAYFEQIGLLSKEGTEGRIYPHSESANTVLDVLRLQLNKLGVIVKNNFEVNQIMYRDNKYLIYNKNHRNTYLEADYLVFACGGCAAPILGSNGTGYSLLKPFKIKVSALYPGLVGLKSDMPYLKSLNGLRFKAGVSVCDKKSKKSVYSSFGEVQFKTDGISGIVVMEASSFIARNPGNYFLELDFMKDYHQSKIEFLLEQRKKDFANFEVEYLLTGILPKMIGNVIIKKVGINQNRYISDLKSSEIIKVASMIKYFPIDVKGTYGFERAQVTVGGVELDEIDKHTLAVKKAKNAYICGEMMNIDGECGGYNLQWAMSSGYIVGTNIAARIDKDVKNK